MNVEPADRLRVMLSHPIGLGLAFAVGYYLLDRISFIYPLHELNITPWDPQPALAIALLYLKGTRWLPWVYVTVLGSEFLALEVPLHLPGALLLTFVLTLGYASIASLMKGPLDVEPRLATRRDVVNLAASVVLGSGCTGIAYVALLCVSGFLPWEAYPAALFRFWLGDTIGLLVILPLLLFLAESSRRRELAALTRDRSALTAFVFVLGVLAIVFLRNEAEQYKFFYLLFLPIIWIAARHGLAGALGAVAMIQAGIIIAVLSSDHQIIEVLELQTLLLCVVLTGLVLGVAVDESRDASQRLARARELTAVGEMATALAHELNQPLTALSTYSDAMRLLAASPPSPAAHDEITATAERMRRVTTRCADIVARFRALAPRRSTAAQPVSLATIVQSAVDALRERIEQTQARIGIAIESDDLPQPALDRERMVFVFQNLIANAIDAGHARQSALPSVTIALGRDGSKHVRATIRDSGPGIAPNMTEQIFEPFFTDKAQGMGLGLAICRSIVESHGGRLWAEPGTSGILQVRLPL